MSGTAIPGGDINNILNKEVSLITKSKIRYTGLMVEINA